MIRTSRVLAVAITLVTISSVGHAQRRGASQGGGQSGRNASATVAIVNGKKIPLARYQELYSDQANNQRKMGYDTTVDLANADAIFRQVVQEELLRQEAAKHKIVVTRDGALKALLENPPDFMRPPFTDDNGVFHEETFRQVVRNPDLFAQLVGGSAANQKKLVASWKEDVEKVIRYVQNEELKRRLGEALYAAKPLSEKQIKNRFFAERTSLVGSFVRVLHSTVPDSLVPVSDEDARAWYKSHQEDYSFSAARYVSSFIIPLIALPSDSAAQRSKVESAREILQAAPVSERPRLMRELSRGLPENRFSDEPMSLLRVPERARDQIAASKTGDVFGPYDVDGEKILLYVEGTGATEDTVLRARHILVKPGGAEQDSMIYQLLSDVKKQITSDSAFIAMARLYGQDATASRGGDLGYFGRGTMVPEFDAATANAAIGEVIGPVKTQFGQHLIMITERRTTGHRLRELRFPLAVSPQASDLVMNDAALWAEGLRNPGPNTDSLFAEIRNRHPGALADTSLLRRLDQYGDAMSITNFAFNAEQGEVAIIRLPYDRLAVVKLLRSWPAGVAPYGDIKYSYVIPHVQRSRQLDILRPTMEALRDTMTPDMTLGVIRLSAPMAEAFMVENRALTSPPDEDPTILDSMLAVAGNGSVNGPVRGVHAYYFLRVVEKTISPTQEEYARERENFSRRYLQQYREKLVDDLMIKASNFAEVTDQRPPVSIVLRQ